MTSGAGQREEPDIREAGEQGLREGTDLREEAERCLRALAAFGEAAP